jgi:cytochrome c oxidase subunit 2
MEDLPFFPDQASTVAQQWDILFFTLTGLSTVITIAIAALIIFFAIRYHRRHEDEVPEQIHGSIKLEIGWTIPLFTLGMVAFFWGATLYFQMFDVPDDALEIYVIGKQWMWKYQHPDGQQEINDLHIPVGRPVKLTMTSQDVIHSFFVPDFRVKQDVLPGRYTEMWFEATETGTYHIFCAEYCGTEHSGMVGTVYVMEEVEYQEWLTGDIAVGAPEDTPVEQGRALYQDLGCESCHRLDGTGPGPSLEGIFGEQEELADGSTITVDETYIRTSLLEPNEHIVAGYDPIMPTYEGQVDEEQIIALIEYIQSLGSENEGATSD